MCVAATFVVDEMDVCVDARSPGGARAAVLDACVVRLGKGCMARGSADNEIGTGLLFGVRCKMRHATNTHTTAITAGTIATQW